MMFYGIGNRAEISAYAFDVVYRQIFCRPTQIFKKLPSKKASAQNLSCRPILQWLDCGCLGGSQKFEMSDEEKAVMDRYAKKEHSDIVEAKTRDAKSSNLQGSKMEYEALAQGMESGKQVQLHHAMSGTDGVKQIGEQK